MVKVSMELRVLAERVEALTGPDRELDDLICSALFERPTGKRFDYTASLDAAMTLLDPMWGYEQRRPSDGQQRHYAELWWVPEFPSKVFGVGNSPALALTAASLRAIASMGSGG